MLNIQPVGTKLLVKPIKKQEEKLESGLYMPETANAELMEGEVVSVSSQINDLFKVGDIILYPSRKGVSSIIGGQPYLWLDSMPEKEEIWGVKIQK